MYTTMRIFCVEKSQPREKKWEHAGVFLCKMPEVKNYFRDKEEFLIKIEQEEEMNLRTGNFWHSNNKTMFSCRGKLKFDTIALP